MQRTLLKPVLLDLLNDTQTSQQTLLAELSEAERDTIGTPEHWSARDHVAHITFWKRSLLLRLAAVERGEIPPRFDDFEQFNAQTFEKNRLRPFSDILLESEQTHGELIARVQGFTEDDLASSDRFVLEDEDDGIFPGGRPLWDYILGSGCWHPQAHFIQFYVDRNEVGRATQMQEGWVNILAERDASPAIRGIALYNFACFYAITNQLEKASGILQQALVLDPTLTEWSKQDPDLASLFGDQTTRS